MLLQLRYAVVSTGVIPNAPRSHQRGEESRANHINLTLTKVNPGRGRPGLRVSLSRATTPMPGLAGHRGALGY